MEPTRTAAQSGSVLVRHKERYGSMTEPHGIDFPYQLEKLVSQHYKQWEEKMDVTVLMIVNDKVISRTTCDENLAEVLCVSLKDKSRIVTDYIVVSRDDDILWIVDGMTPGWIIPESTEDVLNRYPELKGKF